MRLSSSPFTRASMMVLIASIFLSFVGSRANEEDSKPMLKKEENRELMGAKTDHDGLPQLKRQELLTMFSCSVCDALVEDVYR